MLLAEREDIKDKGDKEEKAMEGESIEILLF